MYLALSMHACRAGAHLLPGLVSLRAGVLQACDELVLHAVEALVQVALLVHQAAYVVLQEAAAGHAA